jgi:polar amino acid transport system substrate-binding protein
MARRLSPVLLVAGLATAVLALGGCGSDSLNQTGTSTSPAPVTSPAEDTGLAARLPEKIKQAGTIVVGVDATYAPNEFLDADGKTVKGMDVDLFDALAQKFGVTVQWVPAKFDSIILGVDSGKYDVGVSSFTINDKRKQQVTMVSYFNAGTQWIVPKGNPKKVDPNNACGLNVGVQTGTVQADEDLPAKSKACTDAGKPAINPIVDADQGKVTTSVLSGKADAMLADSPVGLWAAKETGGQLEPVGQIYDAAPYGFVLPKSETDFGQAMVQALQELRSSGAYAQILSTWGNESGAISDFAVNP